MNDTLNVEDDYIQQYDSLGYYVYSWTEPNLIRLMRYDHKNFALFNMKEEKIYLLEFVTPTP